MMAASVSRPFAWFVHSRSSCRCWASGAADPDPPVLTMPGSSLTWIALSELSPGPQYPTTELDTAITRSGTKIRASAAASPPAMIATPHSRRNSRPADCITAPPPGRPSLLGHQAAGTVTHHDTLLPG